MAVYLEFLNKLLALGANLPKLLPIFLQLIDLLQQAAVVLGLQPKMMGAESGDNLSGAEMTAEGKVLALCGESDKFGAIGDGSIIEAIRNVWAFVKTTPELLQVAQWILAFLLKYKPA